MISQNQDHTGSWNLLSWKTGTRGNVMAAADNLAMQGALGGRFKKAYELLNLRALKISMLYKSHIFQRMGKIFCVEFQREPLKFHTKYLTHTLKDAIFIQHWYFKSSWI